MSVITIVIRTFEIVAMNLEKRLGELKIRGRIETTETTTFLLSYRILDELPRFGISQKDENFTGNGIMGYSLWFGWFV